MLASMNPWIFFAGAAVISGLFYVEGLLLAGRFFGVRVREIGIGVGPLAFTRGRLVVRWLPLGALVYFHDTRFGEDKDPAGSFDHAPRSTRVSIRLMDVLVYLLPAFLVLGLDAWRSFVSGFGQLFTILVEPTAEGVELVRGFLDIVESGDVGRAIGIWFAKSAALTAVPFVPVAGGGGVLFELLSRPGANFQTGTAAALMVLGALAILAFLVKFVWVFFAAVL